ncbi:MAG: CpaF family protein [Actinomycetia bacterium]|nr:CpaF family protein [Actinomycetes bacterium]
MSLKARLAGQAGSPAPAAGTRPDRPAVDYLSSQFIALKARVQEQLLDQEARPEELDRQQLEERIGAIVNAVVATDASISPLERDALVTGLIDELTGFGPIQPLLDDPEITEIMINGPHRVYIERHGRLERTRIQFRDAQHLKAILEKMLAPTGRRVDEASPMVDARLPDGSRLNAVIAPVAVDGDAVTIRKFARDPFTLPQLVAMGTLSPEMAEFLEAAVRGRVSLIVSGGTGSGKTTTLNALSAYIPPTERIVTIEDAAELQLQQEHKVALEARPPNVEGKGEITIRALVRNALRMRPDRIIVGEVRGGEALDMLQAMNTGHEGSLTTAHANSPRDCLSRLETMVLMAGADLPLAAIRQQIASAIQLIVQQARLQDGTRRIVRITEVVGMEEGVITTQDLFLFDQETVDRSGRVQGRFRATGIRPRCLEQLERHGITLPASLFGG